VVRHIRKLVGADVVAQPSDTELLERFVAGREEEAFATLLRRHGPLVWSVCWQVLHHRQDAEDAFQATLLLLARQAGSIRRSEAVASWLYRVAYRVARKAGQNLANRRRKESQVAQRSVSPPEAEAGWRELQAILNEELGRLPEKYRAPFILCCLEGQSGPEAASRLGWKVGTVTGRLSEARKLLQHRLARRGVLLSAVPAAAALGHQGATAASSTLTEGTTKAALALAARAPTAGLISARAAALVQGMSRKLIVTRLKLATALVLAASLVTATAALAPRLTAEDEAPKPPSSTVARPPTVAAKPAATADKDSIVYSGRVLGPDGRPVSGASLTLTLGLEVSADCATTGSDGHFRFSVPKARFGDYWTVVTATAAPYGPGWVVVPADGRRDELTFHLVGDDVPITGQIVDLQAKPVAGATLRVLRIDAASGEDLGPWLQAIRDKKGPSLRLQKQYLGLSTLAVQTRVTTDAAGRFRLTGIGRNRLVLAQLEGPTITSQELYILTRSGKTFEVPLLDGRPPSGTPNYVTTYYAASFRHVASPNRPVVGTIRDKDTGKPLVGMTVQSYRLANYKLGGLGIVQATTDEHGRYRLNGMPKGPGNKILVRAADDRPYLEAAAEVPDPPGFEPVEVDFALKRALWIEGRLTDKTTGKPVQADIYYLARIGNTYVPEYTNYEPGPGRQVANVQADGRFRVAGLPGPGFLAVFAGGKYLPALERDDAEGTRDLHTMTIPFRVSTEGHNALTPINPPKGTEVYRRDVTVDPGLTVTGTLFGPDGKPLAGARAYCLTGRSGWGGKPLPTASFTVRAFNPRRPRPIFFLHPERRLVGAFQPPADDPAPVSIHMSAGAAVTGRLVDADGQPRSNVELSLAFRSRARDLWASYFPDAVRTGPDGRFRIETLLPGQQFYLSDGRGERYFGEGLRAGMTKDLGDIQLKRPR
jgi:RNA polymerase sigma factor (sigma-70 family)